MRIGLGIGICDQAALGGGASLIGWVLATGIWNDNAFWSDAAFWKD